MILLLFYCITSTAFVHGKYTTTADVSEAINDYFKDETVKAFQSKWALYKESYENAMETFLQESYGRTNLDFKVLDDRNKRLVSEGFYVNDLEVEVLIGPMDLSEMPQLKLPDVKLDLSENVLRVESVLGKMLVSSRYRLFRNQTAVRKVRKEENNGSSESTSVWESPFTSPDVALFADLTISADNCRVMSMMFTKMLGQSVSVGHDTTFLVDCLFSVEIYRDGFGAPPVIAPYFSKQKAAELMQLLTKPVRTELRKRVQAALLSNVNCSSLFNDDLFQYKSKQRALFTKTNHYLRNVVTELNKITTSKAQDPLALTELQTSMLEKNDIGEDELFGVSLANANLYGLDTAYSSHAGGALKLVSPIIMDAVRFNDLHVRGNITRVNHTELLEIQFAAELLDASVDVVLDLNDNNPVQRVAFTGWRDLQVSMTYIPDDVALRNGTHTLIASYVTEHLPKTLNKYLEETLPAAITRVKGHKITTTSKSYKEED